MGSKIGGTPYFIQEDQFPAVEVDVEDWSTVMGSKSFEWSVDNIQEGQFPDENEEDWLLVLQLDSNEVPFQINFGDCGVGYAFVKADGSDGRFLWQCT